MGIYEDRQFHTKTGFRPVKLQESRSGPHTNRTPSNNIIYCMTSNKIHNLFEIWIMEHRPSIQIRIDGPDCLYDFWLKKTKDFGKRLKKLSTEDSEQLVASGKCSVNFRRLSGKLKNKNYHVYSRVSNNLHSVKISPSMFWIFQSGSKLLDNCF